MKPQLSIEAFADWCEKQPAEMEYDYSMPFHCAAAQYFKSLGLEKIGWRGCELPAGWQEALNPTDFAVPDVPRTFVALAARLRSVQS